MHSILCQKTYALFCSFSETIRQFPKYDRHALGKHLDDGCLCLLEAIITAEQTVPVLKDRALLDASIKTEIVKLLVRIAAEKKVISPACYFDWSEQLVEIGKMIGGWRASLRA